MQKTLTVPAWVYSAYHFVVHNWTVVVGVIVVAIIASIALELVKRQHNKKQLNNLGKKALAWLLVVFSALFSALAYFLIYAQGHLSALKALPIIGSHTTQSIGLAYALYNIRLNKYYKAFAAWASKETGKPVAVTSAVTPAVPSDPSANEFV